MDVDWIEDSTPFLHCLTLEWLTHSNRGDWSAVVISLTCVLNETSTPNLCFSDVPSSRESEAPIGCGGGQNDMADSNILVIWIYTLVRFDRGMRKTREREMSLKEKTDKTVPKKKKNRGLTYQELLNNGHPKGLRSLGRILTHVYYCIECTVTNEHQKEKRKEGLEEELDSIQAAGTGRTTRRLKELDLLPRTLAGC